jgi:hypothetical protein
MAQSKNIRQQLGLPQSSLIDSGRGNDCATVAYPPVSSGCGEKTLHSPDPLDPKYAHFWDDCAPKSTSEPLKKGQKKGQKKGSEKKELTHTYQSQQNKAQSQSVQVGIKLANSYIYHSVNPSPSLHGKFNPRYKTKHSLAGETATRALSPAILNECCSHYAVSYNIPVKQRGWGDDKGWSRLQETYPRVYQLLYRQSIKVEMRAFARGDGWVDKTDDGWLIWAMNGFVGAERVKYQERRQGIGAWHCHLLVSSSSALSRRDLAVLRGKLKAILGFNPTNRHGVSILPCCDVRGWVKYLERNVAKTQSLKPRRRLLTTKRKHIDVVDGEVVAEQAERQNEGQNKAQSASQTTINMSLPAKVDCGASCCVVAQMVRKVKCHYIHISINNRCFHCHSPPLPPLKK